MRGFRGSRAAQNDMAHRHGRHDQPQFQQANGRYPSPQGDSSQQRPALPDWLKTPETRAKEAEQARNPGLKIVPALPPQAQALPPRPIQPRTELKLVKNEAAPIKAEPAKR